MDMGGGDPDDITTVLYLAFGLVIAGFLFLSPVGRPSIVSATLDMEPGMRQGPKGDGEIIQAFLKQDAGHGVNHFHPLQIPS